VFRGFFEGRYIFDSVTGFLRYTSAPGPGGFGPLTVGCSNGSYVTAPATCPAGTTASGGPLLFYLQSSSPDGIARDEAGASDISNEEFAVFIQDKWRVGRGLTVDFGLRWDAQVMPETVDPASTAYAPFLNDLRFPSDGTIPDQWKQFQPRGGFAWDFKENGKSVVRASAGIYYARQNMLSQVGSVTTNGIQQKSDFRSSGGTDMPVWPNLLPPSSVPAGTFPLFTGVRVFDRDYRNPRIFSFSTGYDQELMPSLAVYFDFTVAKGTHLTRFLNYNVHGTAAAANQPATRDTTTGTLQVQGTVTLNPRVRLGGGGAFGERIFDVVSLQTPTADSWVGYGYMHLTATPAWSFDVALGRARENPYFSQSMLTLGVRRTFARRP